MSLVEKGNIAHKLERQCVSSVEWDITNRVSERAHVLRVPQVVIKLITVNQSANSATQASLVYLGAPRVKIVLKVSTARLMVACAKIVLQVGINLMLADQIAPFATLASIAAMMGALVVNLVRLELHNQTKVPISVMIASPDIILRRKMRKNVFNVKVVSIAKVEQLHANGASKENIVFVGCVRTVSLEDTLIN